MTVTLSLIKYRRIQYECDHPFECYPTSRCTSDQMVNHAVKCLESRHLTAWLTIWSGMYYAHLRVVYIVHMSLLWITEVTTTPLFSASSSMQYGCPMWLSKSEIMVAITPSHQSCIETLDVVLQSVFRAGEIIAFNRVEQKAWPFFLFFRTGI